jgi:hypothetical protein
MLPLYAVILNMGSGENMIRKKILICSLCFCLFSLFICPSFGDQGVQEVIAKMQDALKRKDISSYLEFFIPELREKEEQAIFYKFNQIEMKEVTFFKTDRLNETDDGIRVYQKVLFENSYAVVIEVWRLDFVDNDGQWKVAAKEVTKDISNLFKIQIPSGREERVDLVEIKNVDITISFQNPVVFYDNIPDAETALLVIGEGKILFSPSLPREEHQLEMLYKKGYIEDRISYVYVRCSDSGFKKNIRIKKSDGESLPVEQAERTRAYSLFAKHYARSFTIENSLNGKLLSFIPQAEETVIEFEGDKTGKLTYIFSPFSEEEITLYQWEKQRFLNIYSPQGENDEKRFFISFGEKYDVQNYRISIDFEPKNFYLSGMAEIDIESKASSLDKVKFKMNPDLEILRISDENNNDLFFTKDRLRTALYVYFLDPVPRDRVSTIKIFYRGKIEPPQEIEDVIAGGQFYEKTYSYVPSWFETYLYSLNAHWYPAPPEGDFFTADIKIIIPPEYSVISNGKLIEKSTLQIVDEVEELDKVGRQVFHFSCQVPVKYLSFVVGKFEEQSRTTDPFPLSYYKAPEVPVPRWNPIEESREILDFYERKFGSYPFETLRIVHRSWQEIGGHSPASFVVLNQLPRVLGSALIMKSDSPVNLTRWSEYFLAHEIAHQWWGQGVTGDSYHDQWISEGLAQFSTILYLKEKHGESAFSDILKNMSKWVRKKSEWGPIILGSRISYFDFYAYQAIIYNKSSLVLNMLKDMLGEERFFSSLREFFSRYKQGAARTGDFVRVFSESSGQDLTPFFNNWFRSHLLPEVKVEQQLKKEGKEYHLKFNIAQLTEPFLFPLWVEWIENGENIKQLIIVDRKEQEAEFRLSHKPKNIRINPDEAVPGKFR